MKKVLLIIVYSILYGMNTYAVPEDDFKFFQNDFILLSYPEHMTVKTELTHERCQVVSLFNENNDKIQISAGENVWVSSLEESINELVAEYNLNNPTTSQCKLAGHAATCIEYSYLLDNTKHNMRITYIYLGTRNWILSLITYKDGADISELLEVERSISPMFKYPKAFTNIEEVINYESQFSHEDRVYDVVEQMPSFRGGNGALMKYLSENMNYPSEAKENGIEGRVICTFVVECDGSITNVKVVKSEYPSLDKEAVRLISGFPKWVPGRQNGAPLRVNYTLPVTFRITEEKEPQ